VVDSESGRVRGSGRRARVDRRVEILGPAAGAADHMVVVLDARVVDGSITGRGSAITRGLITGVATFVGGVAHALPFLISDVDTALSIAYPVVGAELLLIAWIRKRYQQVSLRQSLIQVTLGGALVAGVGIALGHA
jgi:VIT1/CCC1 family predicted Fe2+/Mn2+ transporter